jgi:hypothetical protein
MRIASWAVVFLLLASLLLPSRVPLLAPAPGRLLPPLVPMLLAPGETGWVRSDLTSFSNTADDHPVVAWIAGSSAWVGHPERQPISLPQLVADSLGRDTGLQPSIPFYFQNSRRILDTEVLLGHAISMRPDAIVLTVNPFWAFNNKAVLFKNQLLIHGAGNWWTGRHWPRQLAMVAPRLHVQEHLGRHVARAGRSGEFQRWVDRSITPSLAPASPRWTGRRVQPLAQWIRLGRFDVWPPGRVPVESHWFWQGAVISQADTDRDTWAARLVGQMLRNLETSGIPTLVYCAPVSPRLAEFPPAAAGHARVLDALVELRSEHQGPRLRIIVELPPEVAEGLAFRDLLHLRQGGAERFPDHLAEQLAILLEGT